MPLGLVGAVLDFIACPPTSSQFLGDGWPSQSSASLTIFKLTEPPVPRPSANAVFYRVGFWACMDAGPGTHQKSAPSLTFRGTLEITTLRGDVELFGLTPTPKRLAKATPGATSVSREDIASLRVYAARPLGVQLDWSDDGGAQG